jgi:hypothetical protein
VERTPALKSGISRDLVDGPDNLVRIPTLKHWELNGWFERRHAAYGWLTPRQYLSDKAFSERRAVGLQGLIETGILTP